MATLLDKFLGEALELKDDFLTFIEDVDLEDAAALATTGLAVSELFTDQDVSLPDQVDAQKRGGEITSFQGEAPELQLGAGEGANKTGREATRNRLRVRRSSPVLSSLTTNPLSVQL